MILGEDRRGFCCKDGRASTPTFPIRCNSGDWPTKKGCDGDAGGTFGGHGRGDESDEILYSELDTVIGILGGNREK
jgi:hypothetical protein